MTRRRARVLTTLSLITTLALAAPPGPAVADPGAWNDAQQVTAEDSHTFYGAANAGGAFTAYYTPDSEIAVSHRGPRPGDTWSKPRDLGRSGVSGPLVARPGDAGAVWFAGDSLRDRSYFWDISADGVPSTRRRVSLDRFVVTQAAASKRAMLAAGTTSGFTGRVRAALRHGLGRWELSQPLPVRFVEVVGAFFDRNGAPHVVVVRGTPDDRPGARAPAARHGRHIYEARLRPDGSWTSPRLLGTALDYERPQIATNDDGDLALLTYVDIDGRVVMQVRVRPYGGDWSDPIRFSERYAEMEMDAAGRTVMTGGGEEITLSRISPLGAVTSQQLTDETFSTGNPDPGELSVARNGTAVVALVGERTDPGGTASVVRTFRCVPGEECVQVGDFPAVRFLPTSLASGPSGTAYLIAGDSPPCEGPGVCSWRLPAP